jgi:hypothetical protein
MDHVSEFMQHWNLLDEGAELTNLHGKHRHWTYKDGKAPRTPIQVRHCVHAFYNKGREDSIVLSTTIEISSKRDFWSTQKQMISIQAFLKFKYISVHMVALDLLQEVCIGILTETSSIVRHDRDNICAEIRGLCNIPATTPLGVHEFRRKQRYGSPTNKYQVDSTALAFYTDMKNLDGVKELCNMNIQEGTKNRLFLPIGSTMLPHHPTNEVPPEIHEKLIVKHNRRLESLSQGSIKGLSWIQAETKFQLQVRSGVPNNHLHQRSQAPRHGHEAAWQPQSLYIQGQQERNNHQLQQARESIGRGLHQQLQEHHSEKSPPRRRPHQDLSL